jgi:hypothetical protein
MSATHLAVPRRHARPLRASAADARAFDAPAAPALLGTLTLPDGSAIPVLRRPDDPTTFALGRRDLAGRRVRLSLGAEPLDAQVDRFGRMRLAPESAADLAARLAAGERVEIAQV